jgi:hypothetical protein
MLSLKDQREQWLKKNPMEDPKLNVALLPKHHPERFENYIEILNDKEEALGFKLAEEKDS